MARAGSHPGARRRFEATAGVGFQHDRQLVEPGRLWERQSALRGDGERDGPSCAGIKRQSDYWGEMHDVFDPQFARDVDGSVHDVAGLVKSDPWCVGFFVDNELSWGSVRPQG